MFSIAVDVVYPVTGIQIVVRSDGRANVCYADWPAKVLRVVEQFELIEVCMAEKLSCYCAFVSAKKTNNIIIIIWNSITGFDLEPRIRY